MCDVTLSTDEDFITMSLRYRDRTGEIFVLRHAPPAPVVVLSAHDSGARPTAQDVRLRDRWPHALPRAQRVRRPKHALRRADAREYRDPNDRVLLIGWDVRHPFSLDGKVALLTGANSGLGRTLAVALRDAGAYGGDRRPTRRSQRPRAGSAWAFGGGVRARRLRRGVGRTRGCWHCRALRPHRRPRQQCRRQPARRRYGARPLTTWQHVIDTNLTGAFLCTKHAARHMKEQGSGKIVNVSSVYGAWRAEQGPSGRLHGGKACADWIDQGQCGRVGAAGHPG